MIRGRGGRGAKGPALLTEPALRPHVGIINLLSGILVKDVALSCSSMCPKQPSMSPQSATAILMSYPSPSTASTPLERLENGVQGKSDHGDADDAEIHLRNQEAVLAVDDEIAKTRLRADHLGCHQH